MRYLKQGLACAAALAAVCGLAEAVSATTIDPAGTALTLTSTNFALAVSGGGTLTCTSSTLTGTTPAAGDATTWKSIPLTPVWTGCTAFGLAATVNPSHSCHTAGTQPVLHLHAGPPARGVFTWNLCTIHIVTHATGCTQVIPSQGSLTTGITWTNVSPKSALTFSAAPVSTVTSNGVGFGCPSAGVHTATWSGNYTISSATNVTVTP
jgi:hypothetical protein